MSITLAPAPPVGDLLDAWNLYNTSATAVQAVRPPGLGGGAAAPTLANSGLNGSTNTQSDATYGLRWAINAAADASTGWRGYVMAAGGVAQKPSVPWCNLLTFPLAPGFPDWVWRWRFPLAATVSRVSGLDLWPAATLSLLPAWGGGVGNPGRFPERPSLGFYAPAATWRAAIWPGSSGGGFTPIIDVDTGVSIADMNVLGIDVARDGGNALVRWLSNESVVAEYRPTIPAVLSPAFALLWGGLLHFDILRQGGADSISLFMGSDVPATLRYRGP